MMIRSLYLVLGLGALIPTAIAAPVALATPLVVRDDQNDCADGIPFGNSIFAGIGWEGEKVKKAVEQPGNEAKYFCGSGWKNGRIITGLSIWGTREELHAIKVHYDDGGYSGPFGTPNEHQLDIKWNAGDPIDEILTWGNKKKDAVGRLALTVAKNETVFDTDVYNEEDPQPQTIHSGILLGVRGLVNDRIRTLEFKFMTSKAAKVSIVELKFPGGLENYINTHKDSIEYMNLANVYISNSNPDQPGMEKAYEFANSEEQNTQKTITHGTEKAFSMSVTLTAGGKVGIPLLAEGEVSAAIETGFQMSTMKSESMTSSDTKTLSWKESGTLKPGHAVHCTSWAARGFFNSEYTAVVEVTTVDRKTFQFEQPGRANSISWTEASSNCMDIPLADVPKVPHGQEQKFEAGKENPKPMEPVHRDGPPNTEQQKKTEEPTPNTGAEQPATENTQ